MIGLSMLLHTTLSWWSYVYYFFESVRRWGRSGVGTICRRYDLRRRLGRADLVDYAALHRLEGQPHAALASRVPLPGR